jgi:hypothetical protein
MISIPQYPRMLDTYLRQSSNKLISICSLACTLNQHFSYLKGGMLMLSTHETILDVLVNRVVEEKRILLYEAELRSPPIQINAVKVFVADGN